MIIPNHFQSFGFRDAVQALIKQAEAFLQNAKTQSRFGILILKVCFVSTYSFSLLSRLVSPRFSPWDGRPLVVAACVAGLGRLGSEAARSRSV